MQIGLNESKQRFLLSRDPFLQAPRRNRDHPGCDLVRVTPDAIQVAGNVGPMEQPPPQIDDGLHCPSGAWHLAEHKRDVWLHPRVGALTGGIQSMITGHWM